MKILPAKEMSRIESLAYADGCPEEQFMQNAGTGMAESVKKIIKNNNLAQKVLVFSGPGNNGGDGYVVAGNLLRSGYEVLVYGVDSEETLSPLCLKFRNEFKKAGGIIKNIADPAKNHFSDEGLIVDAIFGTGFHGVPKDPFLQVINQMNASHLPIIALDIPSGLNGTTGIVEGVAVKAKKTLFAGLPKTGFFLNGGMNYCGKLEKIDFGLPEKYIDKAQNSMELFEQESLSGLFPEMKVQRHKYEAGYVIGIAGSPGMEGAAALSSKAALSGGAGIVRLFQPEDMSGHSKCIVEIIEQSYRSENLSPLIESLPRASAVYIGPGMGITPGSIKTVKEVLNHLSQPAVIDADALNIIAKEKLSIPKNCILTPHLGEMRRLLDDKGKGPIDENFLAQCREFVEKNQVTLILKGASTFILHPSMPISVNPYGDPGMATAGSGDVLTGLTASLLAQGLKPRDAAIAAVFLHSYAGEVAARKKTSYCMIAGDIIDSFPKAFQLISTGLI